MFSRELAADLNDSKARSIRQAWQQSVAEAQRTQIAIQENEKEKEKVKDLKYGQNLIKQLGYRRVKDKRPGNEP